MKRIKRTLILVFAALLVLFAYANLRILSETEKLKTVHLASFTLLGDINTVKIAALEKRISETKGVTACTINEEGNTASVIFYPEEVNEIDLTKLLSNSLSLTVRPKSFTITSGGCPVHKIGSSFVGVITLLDLRI